MCCSLNSSKVFDDYIGKQLRDRRIRCNMTLMDVAKKTGISYQQIQKYESACSRISAYLLFKLAHAYNSPIDSFFKELIMHNNDIKLKNNKIREQNNFNILIVEDNPGDEAITRKALQGIDSINILCVHDSNQLMSFLKYKTMCTDFPKPDLIFLDIYLPNKNGIAILKDMKRDSMLGNIPIIMLTSNVDSALMEQSYKYGSSGYICKSFDFVQFKKNITNCIDYWSKTVVSPTRA
ncbi:MAG: response regulator [Alphaproteobacteria bacterium]|nr:response regulator [Alphaproteobacteria bacterium]